ncbi:hypothetical protein GC176_11975 [bacterium]|nr:hypothetical protein [bacterium]
MWKQLRTRTVGIAVLITAVVCALAVNALTLADDATAQQRSIAALLPDDRPVDGIFFCVLPASPEDGWRAIPLPRLVETLLPSQVDSAEKASLSVTTHWKGPGGTSRFQSEWLRSARGVPSELRLPVSIDAVASPSGTILLLSRSTDVDSGVRPEFRCQAFTSDQKPEYELLLSHFGLTAGEARSGMFGIHAPWSPRAPPLHSEALRQFLEKFDQIAARGFVPTLRSGSTGIGYTLETLLDIPENNNPTGDFLGMELKAHRGRDLESLSSKRMNLFLKEPVWTDGLTHRERIPKYGYIDDNGRVALYSTVTSQQNSHGLKLAVNRDQQRLELLFKEHSVAWWSREVLQSRLQEKLTETAFVGATTRGSSRDEKFHYQTVLYCEQPSVDSFLQLVASRDVMLEMRMHIREDGSARNHGSAFRIRLDQLPRLFGRTVLTRSVDADDVPSE